MNESFAYIIQNKVRLKVINGPKLIKYNYKSSIVYYVSVLRKTLINAEMESIG